MKQWLLDKYSEWLFRRVCKRMSLFGFKYMQLCDGAGQIRAVTFSQSHKYVDEIVKKLPYFIYD